LLVGSPITDIRLLRPNDDPSVAPLEFDRDAIAIQAVQLHDERQRQRLVVKRRELELLAARNFLIPQLDLVGIHRIRGLDQQLAGSNSAFRELGSMDF